MLRLTDDIFTTGATVNEIAGILKDPWTDGEGMTHSGAARVDFLAFAGGADIIIS